MSLLCQPHTAVCMMHQLWHCGWQVHEFVSSMNSRRALPRPGDDLVVMGGPPCQVTASRRLDLPVSSLTHVHPLCWPRPKLTQALTGGSEPSVAAPAASHRCSDG